MIRSLTMAPLAHADIEHYFVYLAIDSEQAAIRFHDAVKHTLGFIAEHPDAESARYAELPKLRGVRFIAVRGFPNHFVFYRQPTTKSVRIIRVLHGAMDLPRALKRRR